jgi:hypothetical protein
MICNLVDDDTYLASEDLKMGFRDFIILRCVMLHNVLVGRKGHYFAFETLEVLRTPLIKTSAKVLCNRSKTL